MTDSTSTPQEQEDDQNLWRAMYTAEDGWSPAVAFADHLSVAAPALAEAGGTIHCLHRGHREESFGGKVQPVRWTSFTPASVQPYVTALDEAAQPLPKDASEEQTVAWQAKVQAAAEALEAARKWTPDTWAQGIWSAETPALVNDAGTLRMVFTRTDGWGDANGGTPQLYESELTLEDDEAEFPLEDDEAERPQDDKAKWSRSYPISYGEGALAPALAVLDGKVHLVHVGFDSNRLVHLVRNPEGGWTPAVEDKGETLKTPYVDSERLRWEWQKSGEGMRANLALAAHDGKLHLVHNAFGELMHAVFDGKAWTSTDFETPWGHLPAPVEPGKGEGADVARSRRTAALASYGGKLHAVFPPSEKDADDALRHCTWTEAGGWTRPVPLTGHDSRNTPALLAFKEGPVGAEREALLLVHRGVDRYVPPAPPLPPAPPSIADVVSRGTTITGRTVTDYGRAAWSRLRHDVSLTPVTLKDGKKAVIATWDAVAEYYWGFSWYRDDVAGRNTVVVDRGTLWIHKEGSVRQKYADFQGGSFSSGHFRADVLVTDLEPGTYTFELSASNTHKRGGYWRDELSGHPDTEWWTYIAPGRAVATITI
ncbi:hypothetical protein PL81_24610 [Streptomyces sp. RSD-27]|nr:hypothetical protein PL81_24610 [Streptomyces sp. RSD-27]